MFKKFNKSNLYKCIENISLLKLLNIVKPKRNSRTNSKRQ